MKRAKKCKSSDRSICKHSYIVDALAKERHEILMAHPLKTRSILRQKIKSDKIGAKMLADLARGILLPASWILQKK